METEIYFALVRLHQITNKNSVQNNYQYVGFWSRFFASIIDIIVFLPLSYLFFGEETSSPFHFFLESLIFVIVTFLFWKFRAATPGKILIKAQILDEKTGKKPSTIQYTIRFVSYIISTIPLFLGYFWVAWDKKKQSWHDKLAQTIVVKKNI